MKKLILSLLLVMMFALALPKADAKSTEVDDTTTYEEAPIKVLGW